MFLTHKLLLLLSLKYIPISKIHLALYTQKKKKKIEEIHLS